MPNLFGALRALSVAYLMALTSAVAALEPDLYHPLTGEALAPAPGGGVYVAGNTDGKLGPTPAAGEGLPRAEPIRKQDADVFLAHLDRDGELIWLKQFGSEADDTVNSLVVAENGDLLLVGATSGDLRQQAMEAQLEDSSAPDGSAFVARFSAAGELIWLTQFGRGARDFALDLAVNDAGELFVVGGLTKDEQSPTSLFLHEPFWYRDAFLAKFDHNGEPLWFRPFVLDADQVMSNIALDAGGELVVSGWTAAEFPPGGQVHARSGFIAWFNSGGQLQRIRRDTDPYAVDPFPLLARPDGGVYLAGLTLGPFERDYAPSSTTSPSSDASVTSLAADGSSDWALAFGAQRSYRALDLALAVDGGVVIVGSGNGDVGGEHLGASDAFVIAYGESGTRQWATRFGSELFDETRAVTRSGERIFVTGYLNRTRDDVHGRGQYWFMAALSDDGETLWLRKYENVRHEVTVPQNPESPSAGKQVLVLSGGDVLVAGLTRGALQGQVHHGGQDVFLARFSPAGALHWLEQLGTGADDELLGLVETGAGSTVLGVYGSGGVVLYRVAEAAANRPPVSLPVEPDWQPTVMTYGELAGEPAVLLAGHTPVTDSAHGYQGAAEVNEVFLAVYDPAGSLRWSRTMAVDADQRADALLVRDGTVLVAGQAKSSAIAEFSIDSGVYPYGYLAAFDAAGRAIAWEAFNRSRASGTGGSSMDLVLAPDGDVLVSHRTSSCAPFGERVYRRTNSRTCPDEGFVARFTLDWAWPGMATESPVPSSLLWARAFGYELSYAGEAAALRPNSSVLVAGHGLRSGWVGFGPSSGRDVLLIGFSADGELQGISGFGSLTEDSAYGLAVSGDGVVYVTGHYGGEASFPDRLGYGWFLAALTSDGEQAWLRVGAAED